MPSHIGRTGLRLGKKAPDFILQSTAGGEAALHDFAGRKVLLLFVQPGCSPCQAIVPELNRLQGAGNLQVLAVHNGDVEAARQWTSKVEARFPVLVQQNREVSRRYEVFATPFAFVLNEKGVITAKGIVNHSKHIGFLLSDTRTRAGPAPAQTPLLGTEAEAS
jgi:peroxiredoxin